MYRLMNRKQFGLDLILIDLFEKWSKRFSEIQVLKFFPTVFDIFCCFLEMPESKTEKNIKINNNQNLITIRHFKVDN